MTPEHLAFTILLDIAKQPPLLSCRSFIDLHDHCDANDLGELDTAFDQGDMELCDAAIDLVDQWLACATHFNPRELASVLAALRLYQHDVNDNGLDPMRNMEHFRDATGLPIEPLDIREIDHLCERLNVQTPAEDTNPPPHPAH